MNQVLGIISQIESGEDISLITIAAWEEQFYSLVIDTPDTAPYLKIGQEVIMVFKETEMAIGKNLSGGLSSRNCFPGSITKIISGKILSSVYLDYKGQILCAIITTQSVKALNLLIGDHVIGLVKTNEVSIMQKTY
ncbi:TOBE domain-containing protein [Adhaeribacter aquaticus]|uniref:TOBE domain-containing protein n=1 Tax=Adhaeribacter aquaticus TaxID=299567 RepID=UPI0003FCF0F1|nr:TOBE domain-containing protein [Adhaeribacter aquaticus]